jgi:hypothetical protein
MERSALINKVKTRIDEVSASGDVIVDVGVENTKPFDSIIDELLDESALEILLKAPFYRLPVYKATNLTAKKDTNDDRIGSITLPNDFIRLVSFKMKGWLQPVLSFALPGDAVAIKQSNKYIRGGVAKPVAVLYKDDTSMYINYYSVASASDHEVTEFNYIKSLTADGITDDQLVDAMCWICAGKTLGIIGEKALSDLCYENAKGLMI